VKAAKKAREKMYEKGWPAEPGGNNDPDWKFLVVSLEKMLFSAFAEDYGYLVSIH
jgi:hypothetical protein